ncbi:helix-turn-helix domain-containing protein [Rhodobacter capsulatus]|uniref:helix-turn-helix domain-containing protein n=1 Tax=Rhodobacter capsulatus TaxID=1061 RepID=UPI0003D33412|nr:helix-turn-helix domain-containing protein [Rhodobacter capsulatus]ETD86276.1 hypothetical protein U716_03335 [Rhodobacter capsulatus B6]
MMLHPTQELEPPANPERFTLAKADGKYKGRKPTAQFKQAEALALLAAGTPKREIARKLGISERSVYRVLSAAA